jgi:uncharacterized protein (DUF983 family)
VNRERRSIIKTLTRCLALRCPACGQSAIVERPFQIKHHCPSCNALFKREDGFFVGAIMTNVLTTEVVILVAYLVCMILISSRYQLMLTILFILALVFPAAFYHHSWSIWLGFDYLVESLPKYVGHEPPPLKNRQ